MKSILIRYNSIPKSDYSNMPSIMELVASVKKISDGFGFTSKVHLVFDGSVEFSFNSEEDCSALLLNQVVNEVLDYLQKNGFLSIYVSSISFY